MPTEPTEPTDPTDPTDPTELPPDVQPLDVTGTRSVAVGTVGWVVALLVLLPFTGTLRADGNADWLWTCVAGIGLGVFGLLYCRRRARRLDMAPKPEGTAPQRRGPSEGAGR